MEILNNANWNERSYCDICRKDCNLPSRDEFQARWPYVAHRPLLMNSAGITCVSCSRLGDGLGWAHDTAADTFGWAYYLNNIERPDCAVVECAVGFDPTPITRVATNYELVSIGTICPSIVGKACTRQRSLGFLVEKERLYTTFTDLSLYKHVFQAPIQMSSLDFLCAPPSVINLYYKELAAKRGVTLPDRVNDENVELRFYAEEEHLELVCKLLDLNKVHMEELLAIVLDPARSEADMHVANVRQRPSFYGVSHNRINCLTHKGCELLAFVKERDDDDMLKQICLRPVIPQELWNIMGYDLFGYAGFGTKFPFTRKFVRAECAVRDLAEYRNQVPSLFWQKALGNGISLDSFGPAIMLFLGSLHEVPRVD